MATLPTKAQFLKATDLTLITSGKRAQDVTLQRIDELLDAYARTTEAPAQLVLLGRLFYATDYWLKKADRRDADVNTRRRPAVFTFYKTVVAVLCERTGRSVNDLPNWLIATFGRAMGEHGADVDLENRSAEYLSPQDVAKYRLKFMGGLAYQQKWWEGKTDWVVADTQERNPVKTEIKEFFSGYAVSLGGEFYSGPHFAGAASSGRGRYHSSYFAGEPVLCAGEIQILKGRVVEINVSSGHYTPGANNLAMAVEVLAMAGVNVKMLQVVPYGSPSSKGDAYLRRFSTFAGQGIFSFTPSSPNTPLARHNRHAPVRANQSLIDRGPDLALLVAHWKRTGHGIARKDKCMECKKRSMHWPGLIAMISAAGGIDGFTLPTVLPAVLVPPPP